MAGEGFCTLAHRLRMPAASFTVLRSSFRKKPRLLTHKNRRRATAHDHGPSSLKTAARRATMHGDIRLRVTLSSMLACFYCVSALAFAVRTPTVGRILAAHGAQADEYICYSHTFHRHVVIRGDVKSPQKSTVIESFAWLDEAKKSYPNATLSQCSVLDSVNEELPGMAGASTTEIDEYASEQNPMLLFEDTVQFKDEVLSKYKTSMESVKRVETIGSTSSLAFYFLPKKQAPFIRSRILFLLSPLPEDLDKQDWPLEFSRGFGAGLSVGQVSSILKGLPHLLSADPRSTKLLKPPIYALYEQLRDPVQELNKARSEMGGWLHATDAVDVASIAYLRSLGISKDQCTILLSSFSLSLLSCELDPGWELLGTGNVRSVLQENPLMYLRLRLQLTPSGVFSMIKAHARLSSYSLSNVMTSLDDLQSKLNISSEELRKIITRAPNVVGVSAAKIDERIKFLSEEVNMTPLQIRSTVTRQPSLLLYNVESNLMPKISYFTFELAMSTSNVTQLLVSNPSILGRSLERRIKPTVEMLVENLGLDNRMVGAVLVKTPELLKLNLETNLKPKVDFLKAELGLSEVLLRNFLQSSPRVLAQSIDGSLKPKLKILSEANTNSTDATRTVLSNPSLLLTNRDKLLRRVSAYQNSNMTWDDAFGPRRLRPKNGQRQPGAPSFRPRKMVIEKVDGNTVRVHADVRTAAKAANTTVSNMYSIVRTERAFKGKKYAYGYTTRPMDNNGAIQSKLTTVSENRLSLLGHPQPNITLSSPLSRVRKNIIEALMDSPYPPQSLDNEKTVKMNVFTSGVPLPNKSGDISAAGLSICFPQAQDTDLGPILRPAVEKCLGAQVMPGKDDGTSYRNGEVLLGYPYIRPSRNRCSLYVCRAAMRVVMELLYQQKLLHSDIGSASFHIVIYTDSPYAWEILRDSSRLLRWGAYEYKDEFVYDGDIPEWSANTDILYPLSRVYYRLVTQQLLPRRNSNGTSSQRPPPRLAKDIQVEFRHISDFNRFPSKAGNLAGIESKLPGKLAMKAAMWQYQRNKDFWSV